MQLVILFFYPASHDPEFSDDGRIFLLQYFSFPLGFFLSVKFPWSCPPFVESVRSYFHHEDSLAVWAGAKPISEIRIEHGLVEFTDPLERQRAVKEDFPGVQKEERRMDIAFHVNDFT